MKATDLVGSWRLVEGELCDAAGRVAADVVLGFLYYGVSGAVAAQVALAPREPGDRLAALLGEYVAYVGTYDLDPVEDVVRHHIEASNVRSYVGRVLPRRAKMDGNRLILVPDLADQIDVERGTHGRIVWERTE